MTILSLYINFYLAKTSTLSIRFKVGEIIIKSRLLFSPIIPLTTLRNLFYCSRHNMRCTDRLPERSFLVTILWVFNRSLLIAKKGKKLPNTLPAIVQYSLSMNLESVLGFPVLCALNTHNYFNFVYSCLNLVYF